MGENPNRPPKLSPPSSPQFGQNLVARLWDKDASLWGCPSDEIAPWLGWLDSVDWLRTRQDELLAWAKACCASGKYQRVVVLGMGGSSLAAQVSADLFAPNAPTPTALPLRVLDSTHPDAIAEAAQGDLRKCLFVVASKSGSTLETTDLYHFFRAEAQRQYGDKRAAAQNFVFITDRDSPYQHLAQQHGCAKLFINPSDVGGRYSALSYFGMLPCALAGGDIAEILRRAEAFCAVAKNPTPAQNPALELGELLGCSAVAGRDKLLLELPPTLSAFGLWVEQLLAESSGKDRRGILPLPVAANDRPGDASGWKAQCVWVGYAASLEVKMPKMPKMPALRLQFDAPTQIGAEYLRWEIATAIACTHLRVNPFNQPDVVRSKRATAEFVRRQIQFPEADYRGAGFDLGFDLHVANLDAQSQSADALLADFCANLAANNYVGILAYLPERAEILQSLRQLQRHFFARGVACSVGIGPRYLHSTAQLHKGGPANGRFIQFVAEPRHRQPVPDKNYTFAQLHRAQADGEFTTLAQLGRPLLRVSLGTEPLPALREFVATLLRIVGE